MRLIDADRLKYVVSLAIEAVEKSENDASSVAVLKAMAETFLKIIDEAPSLSTSVLFTRAALDKAYQKGREDALKESGR